jgi:alkylation response protein AidB-like acyl-CoA dehydrogenase
MVKVYCSEMLDFVTDEGVQIHGGYGFHQDYLVERAYRDSRINRIFEGTNEINRLLIPGMLLKRDARGQLALLAAGNAVLENGGGDSSVDPELAMVENAKKIALMCLAVAHRKYQGALDKQQELLMLIADMMIESYAMESALLRSRKLASQGKQSGAADMASVLLRDSLGRVEIAARNVLGSAPDASASAMLQRLAASEPVDAIEVRRRIARRLLQSERYIV